MLQRSTLRTRQPGAVAAVSSFQTGSRDSASGGGHQAGGGGGGAPGSCQGRPNRDKARVLCQL